MTSKSCWKYFCRQTMNVVSIFEKTPSIFSNLYLSVLNTCTALELVFSLGRRGGKTRPRRQLIESSSESPMLQGKRRSLTQREKW